MPTTVPKLGPPRDLLDPGRVTMGLILLAVAAAFFLQAFGVVDAGEVIGDWWPAIFVGLGVAQFIRTRTVFAPAIAIVGGGLVLLRTTGLVHGDLWMYIWPLILAAIAIGILVGRTRSAADGAAVGGDYIRASGIFGGPQLHPTTNALRGASLSAFFGGVTLDLRGTNLAPAGAAITATAAFGGIDLIVPRGWRLALSGTPVFGGIEDKTDRDQVIPDDAPTLRVDGLVAFGGITIRNHT